jgi:hypothetical protein
MSVVDLNGAPVTGEIPDNENLLNLLKRLVTEIESGERVIEDFYLIAGEDGGSRVRSFDNGLTAQAAIIMLEREKFHILCAIEGIKV